MRQICEKNSCTGCRACEYVCPRKAIQFCEDRKGFLYPRIDLKKCIDCGLCRQRCTIYRHNKMNRKGDVFAVWSKDIEKRMQSTSGGVFRLISEKILNMGGIVYGAAFNDDMSVHHLRVDNILDLYKLLGSKYVQSNMKYVYGQVKKDLDEGKMVLFSGVACQVAALKNYLNKEYANLLCIDVLCHGVPSPLMLKDYLSYLENRYHSKILKVNFRYKKPGWTVYSMKIDFESGKRYIKSKFKDPFLSFFTRGEDFMLRPSCYECRFTSPERVGDITLADFWLYKADVKEKKGIENGVNLVLINNDLGMKAFQLIKEEVFYESRTWEEAIKSNRSLVKPWIESKKADIFWKDYSSLSFIELIRKYYVYSVREEFTARRWAWINSHRYLKSVQAMQVLKRLLKRHR